MRRASFTGFDAEALFRIENGDHTYAAPLALRPAPRKRHERATLAGDSIEIAIDILDAGNTAVAHHDFVRGFPMREILHRVAAGLALVFINQVRVRRSRSMINELSPQRMIERLDIDADHLHLLF